MDVSSGSGNFFHVGSGQALAGSGTVLGGVTVDSTGTIDVGDVNTIGLLNLDSLNLASGSSITFEIGTTQYDEVKLASGKTASADSGATLNLLTLPGFNILSLQANDVFHLFDLSAGGNTSLALLSYNLPTAPGLSWDTTHVASEGYIRVATAAVPEPSGWLMGLLAGVPAAIVLLRRRKRKSTKLDL